MPEETAPPSGWWGKFVALLLGIPPIAVQAMDDEEGDDDDEPEPLERHSPR